MNKIRELITKYKELIVYIVFGLCTTVVNLLAFKLMNVVLGDENYLFSNVIAWVAAVVFAFITNKLWVFESKSWKGSVLKKEIPSFVGARLFSLGVEELGLLVFVTLLHFDRFQLDIFGLFTLGGKMIVKIGLAVIVVIMNYVFSKFIIFKNKE